VVPLPPGGRLRVRTILITSAANFVHCNNFAYKKGIFYLNQFALVIEFLQTFSIKYSFLLFKVLVNTIFAEYPKELALTNQPPSGEGLPAFRSLGPRKWWKEPARLRVISNKTNLYYSTINFAFALPSLHSKRMPVCPVSAMPTTKLITAAKST